jgi:hypothetical protein
MDTGTLYFHASCFDGAAAAALALDVLERSLAWKRPFLRPVNYDVRSRWRAMPAGRFAVVDFLYHPAAEFWADHHASPFLTLADRQHAQNRPGSRAHYDASAPSCAGVLWARYATILHERFPAPAQLAAWADKIDSAAYDSVEEALFSTASAMAVSRALAQADASLMVEIVTSLRTTALEDIGRSPQVAALSNRWLDGQGEALRAFRKIARLTDDGTVLFEIEEVHGSFSRYLPFYIFPDARYSLGLVCTASGPKMTAMRNPWLQFESVPLGSIFATFGGGGHQRIGSVILPGASLDAARHAMEQVRAKIAVAEREQRETVRACTNGSTSTTSTPTSSLA